MASFDREHEKTAGKMSDLVIEYVSQFIASDHLEAYDRVMKEERFEFVPSEFDEKIYKKISKQIRKNTGYNMRVLRYIIYATAALVCALCVAFTIFALADGGIRHEILNLL